MSRQHIAADAGMLYHIVAQRRPELAERIRASGRLETVVVGLGRQGTRHAGLMQDYGTEVTAGIAPGRGGTRIHETIPVYDDVAECLAEHPNIVAASIWRHYSTARDAALEVIESGIPLVVLISEGLPLRDVRDILVAAQAHNTLLIGGNTPGVIFPPEGIKVGMLPDVFYPEEPAPGRFGPRGVTIVSRSGAILYHMSDALASVGIAQNAVLGVGGDGAIGATFRDLVPMAMAYANTDLVVIAGEIGGMQEELLAADLRAHPKRYPKPLVALISGAHAPAGKTMGHAGAIVAPGQAYGTYAAKRGALEAAGVTVVNSQYDLIATVQERLDGRSYFETERYYQRMRTLWEAPPPQPSWGTLVTKVEPNNLLVAGYPLQDIIPRRGLLATAHLLLRGEFPDAETLAELASLARDGAQQPGPVTTWREGEDISKALARCLLDDEALADFPQRGTHGPVRKTAFALGRTARYLATLLGHDEALAGAGDAPFGELLLRALTGEGDNTERAQLLEAMVVASVDHGVTPPSAQATLIAATVRATYEVAVAHGVGAITDVHGGAGAKAAQFFARVLARADADGDGGDGDLRTATHAEITAQVRAGRRIEGLGHRVHTRDPRRDALWAMAAEAGVARRHVAVSRIVTEVFTDVRGMTLPINVDGVMGAIVADMGLDPVLAKALFIFGRVAGLSAHYFEEIAAQPRMRRIDFAQAVYRGPDERRVP